MVPYHIQSISFHSQRVRDIINIPIDNSLFHEELWIPIVDISAPGLVKEAETPFELAAGIKKR